MARVIDPSTSQSAFGATTLNDLIIHKPTGRVCVHFVNLQELSLVVYEIALPPFGSLRKFKSIPV